MHSAVFMQFGQLGKPRKSEKSTQYISLKADKKLYAASLWTYRALSWGVAIWGNLESKGQNFNLCCCDNKKFPEQC